MGKLLRRWLQRTQKSEGSGPCSVIVQRKDETSTEISVLEVESFIFNSEKKEPSLLILLIRVKKEAGKYIPKMQLQDSIFPPKAAPAC